jgi:hypothetical protein
VVDRLRIAYRLSHARRVQEVELMARGSSNVVPLGCEQRQERSAEDAGSASDEDSHHTPSNDEGGLEMLW